MYTINIWPIIVSTVVAFGLGALWYSPILFGKEWMELIRMTDADMAAARARGVWKLYIVQLIMSFVSFLILAFMLSSNNAGGGVNGAVYGFLVWLGFVLTIMIGEKIWQKTPWKLLLINSVSILLNLVIGGAIIGAWR